jgi:hypothetical protein
LHLDKIRLAYYGEVPDHARTSACEAQANDTRMKVTEKLVEIFSGVLLQLFRPREEFSSTHRTQRLAIVVY